MSKAILISIKPKWVAKILNGEKTIELRKRFSKDFVGWVYIYCTKDKKYANLINRGGFLTGMVVARFWCDKVEHIEPRIVKWNMKHQTDTINQEELLKMSQLSLVELIKYCGGVGYAIHITKLEIFDKPKELKNFLIYSHTVGGVGFKGEEKQFKILKSLTRAPESFCYIEID